MMLFYKALLAVLVSTSVVSAIPIDLNGQLQGVLGKAPLNVVNLNEIIQQLLGKLEEIKQKLSIPEIGIPEINGVNSIVNGASSMIPQPVSGVVNTVQNAASGVVGTASGVVPGSVSDALNGVKNAASDIGNDVVGMIPHQWLMRL